MPLRNPNHFQLKINSIVFNFKGRDHFAGEVLWN